MLSAIRLQPLRKYLGLATNERLAMIAKVKQVTKGTSNMNHTVLHMFYQCEEYTATLFRVIKFIVKYNQFQILKSYTMMLHMTLCIRKQGVISSYIFISSLYGKLRNKI